MRIIISILFLLAVACNESEEINTKEASTSPYGTTANILVDKAIDTLNEVPTVILYEDTSSSQHKTKNKRAPSIDMIEVEDEIITSEKEKRRPSIITTTYNETKDSIRFFFKQINPEVPGIGCSSSEYQSEFVIPMRNTHFDFQNQELNSIRFMHHIQGGLYWASGNKPLSGFIKGTKTDDNTWSVEVDLKILMHGEPTDEDYELRVIINNNFIR